MKVGSKWGSILVEEGPVAIRESTESNMEFAITDWHSNQYEVADEDELRDLRSAINELLDEEDN